MKSEVNWNLPSSLAIAGLLALLTAGRCHTLFTQVLAKGFCRLHSALTMAFRATR